MTLAAALFIQAVAVAFLRIRLGKSWLRHPVTLLVLTGVVYQGVAPLILADSSLGARDPFRIGIAPGCTDNAALLLAACTFALTAAYLMTRPERVDLAVSAKDAGTVAKVLDWRILALMCLPTAILTYRGQGYNTVLATSAKTVSVNLAASFFTVLVVLAAFAFLLRHGTRWFLPVCITQAAIVAATGERLPILINTVALILLLARAGRRPPLRGLLVALSLALLGALAVTGVRAEQGRTIYEQNSSLGARLSVLGEGLTAGVSVAALGVQAATRLDGTSFTAAVLQDRSFGQPALGAAYIPESLLVVVPSALWPFKLEHGYGVTSPYALEIADFGVQNINPLPGLDGYYTGFLSPAWLIAFMALLGLLAGRAERWLLRECTPARLVLLAGAATTVLWFEKGLPGMLVQMRSAIVLAAAVKTVQVALLPLLSSRARNRRIIQTSAPCSSRTRA